MNAIALPLFAASLIIILAQHVIHKKIVKINELLDRQMECEKSMIDDLSKNAIVLNKTISDLQNKNALLQKENAGLEQKLKKINAQVDKFNSIFKVEKN